MRQEDASLRPSQPYVVDATGCKHAAGEGPQTEQGLQEMVVNGLRASTVEGVSLYHDRPLNAVVSLQARTTPCGPLSRCRQKGKAILLATMICKSADLPSSIWKAGRQTI